MEIIDQKILHDSVRWPLSPLYEVRMFPGEITKEESAAGDIVIANKGGDKRIIKQSEYTTNSALYTEKGYQPIAVVVVPASHTDDGTARCMSLNFMSCDSKTGSETRSYVYWGNDHLDCETKSKPSSGYAYGVHGTTTIAYMSYNYGCPSNNAHWGSDGYLNLSLDPGAPVVRTSLIVSPYDTDGISKNPDFFVEGGIGEYMTGKEDTASIISKVDSRVESVSDTWLTDSSITNNSLYYSPDNTGNFPAAMCCYRYYTTGTKQKDWYLPAAGEAIYLIPRNKEIVDSIVLCGKGSRTSSSSLPYTLEQSSIFTSTEGYYTPGNYAEYVQEITFYNGQVMDINKQYNLCVVAFIKI